MNSNLKNLDDDILLHLGYSKSEGLDVLFGDIKVNFLQLSCCIDVANIVGYVMISAVL